MDAVSSLVDALSQLGVQAATAGLASDGASDLVVEPEGVAVHVRVKHRSLVTDEVARRLLDEPGRGDATLVVVSDRVTETARNELTSRRGGYLDLRGHLALRSDRMVIDADVEVVKERPGRSDALGGRAGLEVATSLLMEPGRPIVVRELARQLNRSPSTVSEVLSALRSDGLVSTEALVGTELFWAVADRWATPRVHLLHSPATSDVHSLKALRLGLDHVETEVGWALTDTAAAVAYGAPLAVRSGQALDFFVSDESIVRRASTLLGRAESAPTTKATVRVAPVPAVVQRRVELPGQKAGWPLAHPLFVALDLAQDVGRGREILSDWNPGGRWARVW